MDEATSTAVVEQLLEAWRSRVPVEPEALPSSLAEGYAIQAAFVAQAGQPAGYKVGFTNTVLQERFGVDAPVTGRLWADRIFGDGDTLQVPGDLALAVEPEFAYRMGADLPADGAPYSAEQVAEAVESIMPALEIVEPRVSDWTSRDAATLVADNVLNSAWVGAAPLTEWDPADVRSQEVVASINSEEVSRGSGAAVLGDPFSVLVWLANELAGRGESLQAGDVITTGCCTDVLQPGHNDEVQADFGSFGSVRVQFSS